MFRCIDFENISVSLGSGHWFSRKSMNELSNLFIKFLDQGFSKFLMPPTLKGWHKIIREMIPLEFLTCVLTCLLTCLLVLLTSFSSSSDPIPEFYWCLLKQYFELEGTFLFFYSIVKDGIFCCLFLVIFMLQVVEMTPLTPKIFWSLLLNTLYSSYTFSCTLLFKGLVSVRFI